MPRINQEEYKFLKNLDDKWKWIARNRDGGLYKFQETPEKIDSFRWNDRKQTWSGIYGNLFHFIQWEDEEPYSIAELIEEYENKEFYDYVGWEHYKKGEAEVKKNIEWAKNRIKNTLKFEALNDIEIGFKQALKETLEILDQIDGSEVEQSDKKIKELESYNDELIRDNNQLRNALDNQEVLSEEWIERNTSPVDDEGRLYVWKSDLQNVIVPKQEKVKVDKEDAENIKHYKEEGWTLFHLINDTGADANHDELLAQAWLAYPNIEVEKEQRYYLKIGNLYLAEPLGDMTSDIVRMTRDKGVAYQFTDEKSIAIHLDKFEGTEAVKVEEMEE